MLSILMSQLAISKRKGKEMFSSYLKPRIWLIGDELHVKFDPRGNILARVVINLLPAQIHFHCSSDLASGRDQCYIQSMNLVSKMAKELTTADIYMSHISYCYSIIPTPSLLPSFAQSYGPMTSIEVFLM